MKRVAIIGAGISGLFIANLFKRSQNYQVSIYEKLNSVKLEEGYGIQLSVNSVKFLNEIGFDTFQNNKKYNPSKISFYSNKSLNKICDLDITDFNSENCMYTTIKRSDLINFLKKDLEGIIKTGFNISKIDQQDRKIKLLFENNEDEECDYLIISDGVFSKSKNIISKHTISPKYNDTLAIRGILKKSSVNIDNKNISLFLGSDFHQVIYPTDDQGDLNFIAIMKYHLSKDDQMNFSLFKDASFIRKILEKVPKENRKFLDSLKELKIFPVFTSNNFFKAHNNNIHLIGDAFFAFPPSFAQGASQSIESAYELFRSIKYNQEINFFKKRVKKTKMVNIRSKFNQYTFHLSNPITIFIRNLFLKKLVKNKKFLEIYLGKIYKN